MRQELENLYLIVRKYDSSNIMTEIKKENVDLKNLDEFLEYNTHNYIVQVEAADKRSLTLKNIITGENVIVDFHSQNELTFVPDSTVPTLRQGQVGFIILRGKARLVRVTELGIFIEELGFYSRDVNVSYYDTLALEEMKKQNITFQDILFENPSFKNSKIIPDSTINTSSGLFKNYTNHFTDHYIFEFYRGELLVGYEQQECHGSQGIYSAFYEYMKEKNYYQEDLFTKGPKR